MFAEHTAGSHQNHTPITQAFAATALTLLAIGCGGASAPKIGTTPQAITFTNPGTQTAGTSQTLSAKSNSGLAVTFTSATPAICSVSGATASFTAAGACTLNANIAANTTYAAAAPVSQSFTVNPAIPAGTTIDIVGYVFLNSSVGNTAATLWQLAPGTPTATATLLPMPGGMTSAMAQSVAVSGSDVYVAGWATNATTGIALYWHNGSPIILPSNLSFSHAYAIAVSGGDVYAVGFEANNSVDGNAMLWVNGVANPLPLPSGFTDAVASAITVSGGNVYIAGTAWGGTNGNTAVYWVNGAPTILAPPSGYTSDYSATGIGVSGGNVYVAGYTQPNSGGGSAILWENSGPPTALPLPLGVLPEQYGANQITVSNNNVYVAGGGATGFSTATAAYWLNGVPTVLTLPNNLQNTLAVASAAQIALVGTDLYAAGSFYDTNLGNLQAAAYWVDSGAVTLLPMPTGASEAWANGIAVATQ